MTEIINGDNSALASAPAIFSTDDFKTKNMNYQEPTREEYLARRTDAEEHFYGLQSFDAPQDAFAVMADRWGECAVDDMHELFVLDDDTMHRVVCRRVLERLFDAEKGLISKQQLSCDLQLDGAEQITDFLFDFDFLFYSKAGKKYYTSRINFKDDGFGYYSDRQWGIFYELCELVNIHTCVEEALDIFNAFKSSEDFGTEWDDIYDLEACNGLCI